MQNLENFLKSGFIINKIVQITQFKKIFKNTSKTRKVLFGRNKFENESLFENILSVSKWKHDCFINSNNDESSQEYQNLITSYIEVIQYIWSEFRLWDRPEIFAMVRSLNIIIKADSIYKILSSNLEKLILQIFFFTR